MKADESRLLAPGEIEEAIDKVMQGWCDGTPEEDDVTIPQGIAQAQDAKTSSILKAEHDKEFTALYRERKGEVWYWQG